jgi:hypothetical protein
MTIFSFCRKSITNTSKASSSETYTSKKTIPKTPCSDKKVCQTRNNAPEVETNDGAVPSCEIVPNKSAVQCIKKPDDLNTGILTKDAGCQCPEEKLVTISTETQYYGTDCKHCIANRLPDCNTNVVKNCSEVSEVKQVYFDLTNLANRHLILHLLEFGTG